MKRVFASIAVIGVTIVGMALPASAHVFISPTSAEKGSDAFLSLVVHNDDKGNVNKIELQMPTDATLGDVAVHPTPGWTDSATTTKNSAGDNVVTSITWQGGAIKEGDYETFGFYVTPLPSTGSSLQFKTIESFDSGDVTRWVDAPAPANTSGKTQMSNDSTHPTPALQLVEASAATKTTTTKASNKDGLIYTGVGLGAVALLIGLVALVKKK